MQSELIQNTIKKINRIKSHLPIYFHSEVKKQLFKTILNLRQGKKGLQKGGSTQEFIQTYHGYEFIVFIDREDDDITITLRTHTKNPDDCAIAAIDLNNRTAIIHGLSHHSECTKPYIPQNSKGGSIILRFLLGFLTKNAKTFNINRLVLEDNAKKNCANCDRDMRLSDLYFLMNGDTWYGKYGFRPYDKNDDVPDLERLVKYKTNQQIIRSAKLKDVPLVELMTETCKKIDTKIDMVELGLKLKTLKNKPLSDVIKNLMHNYDHFCCIFVHIINRIYDILGMYRFFGESFYVDISDIKFPKN